MGTPIVLKSSSSFCVSAAVSAPEPMGMFRSSARGGTLADDAPFIASSGGKAHRGLGRTIRRARSQIIRRKVRGRLGAGRAPSPAITSMSMGVCGAARIRPRSIADCEASPSAAVDPASPSDPTRENRAGLNRASGAASRAKTAERRRARGGR